MSSFGEMEIPREWVDPVTERDERDLEVLALKAFLRQVAHVSSLALAGEMDMGKAMSDVALLTSDFR